eukprot:9939497-Alexandrium_andersonii.AAC.1
MQKRPAGQAHARSTQKRLAGQAHVRSTRARVRADSAQNSFLKMDTWAGTCKLLELFSGSGNLSAAAKSSWMGGGSHA